MSYGYSVTEQELQRVTTINNSDLVRVVANGASRNVVYSDFLTDVTNTVAQSGAQSALVQTVTANTILTINSPEVTLCDTTASQIIITLPSATDAFTNTGGRLFTFKKITTGTNNVIINPQSGQTIDNDTDVQLIGNDLPAVSLVSDSSNWWIVGS